jgi:hypothetical protein
VERAEQRRASRYRGRLPVELESGKGFTRDFNGSGIFFETDRSFFLGQPIEFTLVLEHIDHTGPIRVTCRGEIVRVEETGCMNGIAASIASYAFEVVQGTTKGCFVG